MSIYGTYGRIWTLTRIGRDMGSSTRCDECGIHRRRDDSREVLTRKKSRTFAPHHESDRMDDMYRIPD